MQVPSAPITLPFDVSTGCFSSETMQRMMAMFFLPPVAMSASGAIDPNLQQRIWITKAGVAAITAVAPTVGASDNHRIELISTTDFAHTLTATGLLVTGSASKNVATFAAKAGATLTLLPYQGKFYVIGQNQITFS